MLVAERAVESADQPAPRSATSVSLAPTGWWLSAMFCGLALWWALGLVGVVQIIFAAPLIFWLARRDRVAVPPGFWLWLLFLGWMLLSVVGVSDLDRSVAFGWRAGAYVSAGLILLYVYNTPRRRLTMRRVVNMIAVFWAVTVAGGFLGMVVPSFGFTSPLEVVLPASVTDNEFVKAMVHPSTTAERAFAGTSIHRPKAPFPYTNQWAASYAVSLPFAIAAFRAARSRVARNALLGLLIFSIVPLVFSLNRGAWLSVAAGLIYAVLRLAHGRRRKVAIGFAALAAAVIAVAYVSPLGDLVELRLDSGYGDRKRELLYRTSIEVVSQSPLLGEGTPVTLEENPDSPSVGTHGQFWTVLVSHGVPGATFFVGFFVVALVSTGRRRRLPPDRDDDARFWCHIAIFVGLVQLPYYELVPWGLPILMTGAALAWREAKADHPEPRRPVIEPNSSAPSAVVEGAATPSGAAWAKPRASVEAMVAAPALASTATSSRPDGATTTRSGPLVEWLHEPAHGAARPVRRTGSSERSELATLARGGALTLFGAGASAVLGFVYVVVLGRGLGAGGAGLLLEAIALFMICANAAGLGADTGLIRMIPLFRTAGRARDARNTVLVALCPATVASLALGALVYVFAPDLARVFMQGEHVDQGADQIRLLAPFLPLATFMTVSLAATRAFGTMLPYVGIFNLGVPLLRPLIAVMVIGAGLGVSAVALSWGGVYLAAAVAALAALVTTLARFQPGEGEAGVPSRYRALAAEFWRFTAPRGVAAIMQVTFLWLDILLVGAFVSTRAAGIYAAASRYVLAGTFALNAMGLAIGPQVSRLLAEGRRDRARQVFQAGTWWLMAVSWPAYLTMAIFSPVLMGVFGDEFSSGATALSILAVALLALMATGNNKIVLLMAGKSSWNMAITAVTLSLNLGLDLWLIPRHGINGAAVGWGVATIVDNVLTTVALHRGTKLDPFGRGYPVVVAASIGCFAVPGIVLRSAFGASWPVLGGFLALACPVFGLALWRSRRLLRFDAFRSMVGSHGSDEWG